MSAINFKMWRHALTTIPRIEKEEWVKLDVVSKWLISTRASVFIMTAISSIIGGIMALNHGTFIVSNFIAAFLGLIFAHASNNLVNDLTDSAKGIDKDNYFRAQYGPQPIEHGLLSKKTIYNYLAVSLTIAILCGAYLIWQTGITTFYFFLIGLFFLLFYTWPLKFIGLGELTVIAVWGPLMVGGTYFVTTGGHWSWPVMILGLIYAMGPTAVIFGKHIDKAPEDRKKKVFTLPVILGETASRYIIIGAWILQYIFLGWLIYIGYLSFVVAIVLFSIPMFIDAVKIYLKERPKEKPEGTMGLGWPLYFVRTAFVYNKRFGILLVLGLIIDLIVRKIGLL